MAHNRLFDKVEERTNHAQAVCLFGRISAGVAEVAGVVAIVTVVCKNNGASA